jgi:hypothetical protein
MIWAISLVLLALALSTLGLVGMTFASWTLTALVTSARRGRAFEISFAAFLLSQILWFMIGIGGLLWALGLGR